MSASRRRAGVLGCLLGLVGLGLWTFHSLGRWFQSGDEPAAADMIVVLSGMPSRSVKAAELYRAGHAPEVWVSRPRRDPWLEGLEAAGIKLPPEEEIHKGALLKGGVPEVRIRLYGRDVLSTANEALDLGRALDREPARLLLVTTRTHCRRARLIFARAFPAASVRCVSADAHPPVSRWWTDKNVAQAVVMETIRTLFYLGGGRFLGWPPSKP